MYTRFFAYNKFSAKETLTVSWIPVTTLIVSLVQKRLRSGLHKGHTVIQNQMSLAFEKYRVGRNKELATTGILRFCKCF